MQFSVSKPGLKKLKANWHIELDEELDIFNGVNEENRITSTSFDNEEIAVVLSLWSKSVQLVPEANLQSQQRCVRSPARNQATSPVDERIIFPGQMVNLMVEAKFACERKVMFISATTLELPYGCRVVGETKRGTISNGSTCRSTLSVPESLISMYLEINFVLGYYTNEAERFVSRKAHKKYNAAPRAASWLRRAFERERFFDCVIKVRDQEIKAHRVVLGAQSKVFDSMFVTKGTDAGTDQCHTDVVFINDISYEAVKAMIEYLYDRSLENVYNCVGEVFRLADEFQIENLKYHCLDIMGKEVDEKNFCQIWASVYLYAAGRMKEMCKDFIRKHRYFLTSEEWKEFTAKNKDAALKLYEYLAMP